MPRQRSKLGVRVHRRSERDHEGPHLDHRKAGISGPKEPQVAQEEEKEEDVDG